jgi:hypothetical protein
MNKIPCGTLKYFPWLKGLKIARCVAYRVPVKGDYFVGHNWGIVLAVTDQKRKKVRQIVIPIDRDAE